MELRQLRYFAAVAREGNFSAAAAIVRVAQPALSRQVRDLEDEIGADLIDRRGRRIRLTHAGGIFADHARRILETIDSAVAATRLAATGNTDLLRIGMAGNLADRHLGLIMRAWCDADTEADVDFQSMDLVALRVALRNFDIDMGLGPTPLADGSLISVPLWQEAMTVVLPSHHPLASSKIIDPCDIGDDRILLTTCNADLLALATQLLDDAGIMPKATQKTDSYSTALALVAAGRGIAIVPELSGRSAPEGVSLVPLQSPKASFEVGLIHRAGETSPAVLSFIEIAKEVVRQRMPRTARPPRPRAIARAV